MTRNEKSLTLVLLAAGLGSRFGGPKQLKPLGPGGNTLLEYAIHDAIRAGFRNIVFVIQTPLAGDFQTLASRLPDEVSVSFAFQDTFWPEGLPRHERTRPFGTGHALLAARHLVNGPFVVCNADDYYGASAFTKAARFLNSKNPDSSDYAMLAYRLDATLSAHGSVSRALCIADNARLVSIEEHTDIERRDGVILSDVSDDELVELEADSQVSMNFWILMPPIFRSLDEEVRNFIKTNRDDESAECRLPDIVEQLVQKDAATVECLPHDDTWFGLTHESDVHAAEHTVRSLHEAATYPTPLWRNDD